MPLTCPDWTADRSFLAVEVLEGGTYTTWQRQLGLPLCVSSHACIHAQPDVSIADHGTCSIVLGGVIDILN